MWRKRTRTLHRARFFTWNGGLVFDVFADLVGVSVSKDISGRTSFSLTMRPRSIRDVTQAKTWRSGQRYMDVLRPNDWVWIDIDPGDGTGQESVVIGLVDEVRESVTLNEGGVRMSAVTVTGSGWQKVFERTTMLCSPFVMDSIPNAAWLVAKKPQWQDFTSCRDAMESTLNAFYKPLTAADATTPEDIAAIQQAAAAVSTATGLVTDQFLGQFEVPVLRKPVVDFVRRLYADLPDKTWANPQSWFSLVATGASVLSVLQQFSNPVMNELLFDVRGVNEAPPSADPLGPLVGYSSSADLRTLADAIAYTHPEKTGGTRVLSTPVMVWRRRPVYEPELLALAVEPRSYAEAAAWNIGRSDADLINFRTLQPPTGVTGEAYLATLPPETFRIDLASVRRHGLRASETKASSWEGDRPAETLSANERWMLRLADEARCRTDLLSGSITFPRFVPKTRIGDALLMVRPDGACDLFYVEGVGYTWSSPGRGTHTFEVTRGRKVGDKPEGTDPRFNVVPRVG